MQSNDRQHSDPGVGWHCGNRAMTDSTVTRVLAGIAGAEYLQAAQ